MTNKQHHYISRLFDIVDEYEYIILDLWGVVHDGQNLYPNVLNIIETLNEKDKEIHFLSNAPRRAIKAANALHNFGVHSALYKNVVTSGEALFHWLPNNNMALGEKYFFIGPDRDLDILDGQPYKRATNIEDADWILDVGYFYDFQPLKELDELLNKAAALAKPMLCANPDIEVVRQNGERMGCAGEIAKAYESLGGKVKYFGKPYGDVYTKTFKEFNKKEIDKKKILAVGDSLHTDIAGANQAGIDSLFVAGGIFKNTLLDGNDYSTDINQQMSQLITENDGANPTYIIKSFGAE